MSILYNKAQCRKCGDIIESKYRHDFVNCKCGAIFVDGAKRLEDIIELTEED